VLLEVVGPTPGYSDRPPFFRIFKNLFTSNCCSSVDIYVDSPPASPNSVIPADTKRLQECSSGNTSPTGVEEQCHNRAKFITQSGDLVMNPMSDGGDHLTQETVQFLDESAGANAGFRYNDGLQHNDNMKESSLKDFLSRPVRIGTLTWNESDFPGNLLTINPWQLFFNNTYVKNKIANFAFVRCNLKVKVLINASPFYYGAMIAAYQPLPTLTPSTIAVDITQNYLIPLSQRPHLWIYPANSEGGEMTLPFFFQKNWLNTQLSQDFIDMGKLEFISYTALQSANGVSSAGVTMQIYAWAEDVELSGPSVGLTMQTDEYPSGIVSGPASAIAAAAGKLKDTPGIGRFATAAQIGASAVSRISSMFGFSNPPVIEDIRSYRPSPFPQMANSEVRFPGEKLTLDPKNELTIDPSTVGLPSEDELSIRSLVQRESFLTQVGWVGTDAPDKILFSTNVTPCLFAALSQTQQTAFYATPQAWISRMFRNWRGDIIFRFKFICTQYHKGRVRISWDPLGNSGANLFNTVDTANVVQTAVVDLGKDTDVEFRVPYHQALPWLVTEQAWSTSTVQWSISATPTWTLDPNKMNGALTVRVQTGLTGPTSTSNITMMVFVKGAENLEFANPCMWKAPSSVFVTQTSEFPHKEGTQGDKPQSVVAGKVHSLPDEQYLINFGERVSTLRSLLHRKYYVRSWRVGNDTASSDQTLSEIWFKFPPHYGYDPAGINTARGLITTASFFQFNYVSLNPITWTMMCFVGVRGSMEWTVNAASVGVLNHVRVVRDPAMEYTAYALDTHNQSFVDSNTSAYRKALYINAGVGGSAITAQRTQQGITVVIPQFNPGKFVSAYPGYRNTINPSNLDYTRYEAVRTELDMSALGSSNQNTDTKVSYYACAGNDFSLLFFLNVPTTYVYNSTPGP